MINTGIQYGTVNINSETAALSSLFFGYLPIIMVTLMQIIFVNFLLCSDLDPREIAKSLRIYADPDWEQSPIPVFR